MACRFSHVTHCIVAHHSLRNPTSHEIDKFLSISCRVRGKKWNSSCESESRDIACLYYRCFAKTKRARSTQIKTNLKWDMGITRCVTAHSTMLLFVQVFLFAIEKFYKDEFLFYRKLRGVDGRREFDIPELSVIDWDLLKRCQWFFFFFFSLANFYCLRWFAWRVWVEIKLNDLNWSGRKIIDNPVLSRYDLKVTLEFFFF